MIKKTAKAKNLLLNNGKKKYRPRLDFQPLQHWKDQIYLFSNYQNIFTEDMLNFYLAYKIHRPDFYPHDCQFLPTMKRGTKSWIRKHLKTVGLLTCEPLTPQRKYKGRLEYDWHQVDWLIASRQLHKCRGTKYDPRIWGWIGRNWQLKTEPLATDILIAVPGPWRSPPKKEGGRDIFLENQKQGKTVGFAAELINDTVSSEAIDKFEARLIDDLERHAAELDKRPFCPQPIKIETAAVEPGIVAEAAAVKPKLVPAPAESPMEIDAFETKLIAELENEDQPEPTKPQKTVDDWKSKMYAKLGVEPPDKSAAVEPETITEMNRIEYIDKFMEGDLYG